MTEEIRDHIESLYQKAEATSSWENSVWGADIETLATAYNLCNLYGYYPAWYPKLCWNYYMQWSFYKMSYNIVLKKQKEIIQSAAEHLNGSNPLYEDDILYLVKYYESYPDLSPGICPEANTRIKNISLLNKYDLDYSSVLLKNCSWVNLIRRRRRIKRWIITTLIKENNSKYGLSVEWHFDSTDIHIIPMLICWQNMIFGLKIEYRENGALYFRIINENNFASSPYAIDLYIPTSSCKVNSLHKEHFRPKVRDNKSKIYYRLRNLFLTLKYYGIRSSNKYRQL